MRMNQRELPPHPEQNVAIVRAAQTLYPRAPFHPPEAYPELQSLGLPREVTPDNGVYTAVRESLRLLELDAARFGTPEWNPLAEVIRPGDRVLVKPNWVSHKHDLDDTWEQIITHGAVLRPILDYVQLALAGQGTIHLADGPMLNSDFDDICQKTGVRGIAALHASLAGACPVEVLDLRSTFFVTRDEVVVERRQLPGDPRGGVVIDLGEKSAFYGFAGEGRYYGADYDTDEVNRHHRGATHEYQLSATAMQADVIIDVPKMKSHHKVGVTLALKGVVGLNCGRNWLPHRTQGSPNQGGDQFAESSWRQRLEHRLVRGFERASLRFPRAAPPLYRLAKRAGKLVFGRSHETIRGGGWHGNDTLWRMVLDINRALTFGDETGQLRTQPTRRRMCIVDGIVAGEGMGPVFASPKACGAIVAGFNPVAVDVATTELIGFDHRRVPHLVGALDAHPLPLAEFTAGQITVASNEAAWSGPLARLTAESPFQFAAPLGWIGHLERSAQVRPA